MTTITIELTDDQARQLASDAERLQLSVQEYAVRRLLSSETSEAVTDSEFNAAMDYVFSKNYELHRRLA